MTQLPEYILETFDETFQVERQVLDSLILERARKLGVRVFQGAEVQLGDSTLATGGSRLRTKTGRSLQTLACKLVVDASGPSALLARHHKLYTRAGLPFQTGAVWAGFENVASLDDGKKWPQKAQFPRDEYTQHFCFREGWMWYIPLVSWAPSASQNMNQMYRDLLGNDGELPSRDELSRRYGCPYQRTVSLGMVLRDDRDRTLTDDPVSAFEHYAAKYPSIASILDQAHPIAGYVGGKTFSSRLRVRGWSRRVTGAGWLAIGDAAFFVDPLISPGMTAGAATAFYAATQTLKALDSDCWEVDEFRDYEEYAHRLHQAHERDSQLVSMSFNHPRSLELVQRFQEIDARRHFDTNIETSYGMADTDVWGILQPDYQEKQKALWEVMREAELAVDSRLSIDEQTDSDYQAMVGEMETLLAPYLEANRDLTPYLTQNERSVPC